MHRLFFAVETPPSLKTDLNTLQLFWEGQFHSWHPVPNFKPEKLANSHCTIRFLGNVEQADVKRVEEAARRAIANSSVAPFECTLAKTGVFPNAKHARVFWIGLTPEEPFQTIQRAFDTGLTEENISFEAEHSFHPHLTLFRFRERYRFPENFEFPTLSVPSVEISEVVLIASKTLPEGPVHTIIEKFPLK